MATKTPPADPFGATRRFAADSSRLQTSVSFYCELALRQDKLSPLLELATGGKVSEGQVVQVACLLRDASIKALSFKAWNSLTVWPALALFVAGAVWPLVNRFSLSLDATASGVIQTALTTTAAALFAVYQQYKQKQGRVEDAIRRTLFAPESIEDKIKRLIELSPSVDTGMSPPERSGEGKPAAKTGKDGGDASPH